MTDNSARDKILAAAMTLISRNGFAATSMNDIVAASGVSKGGVYWHFKSKEEIILAIIDMAFHEQLRYLKDILETESGPSAGIRNLVSAASVSLQAAPELAPTMLDIYALAARNRVVRERLHVYFRDYRTLLTGLVRQGVESGEFSTDDPETAATVFMGALEGILLLNLMTGEDPHRQLELAAQLFLRGMAADRGGKS